jgi:predicted AAA+ superfamily ATPase
LNIQSKTIIEYLSHLESVFFTDRVKRSEVAGKKIFEIGEKFYLEDLGLRHSIVPYQINDISKVLENLVYHHLKVMQYDVYVGKLGDKEIDFVAKKGDNTIYIQVAYMLSDESTRQREFGNLLEIEDNYRKILISMDSFAEGNYKGIEHLHVRKFLMEFE